MSNVVRGAASEGGLGNPDLLAKVASGLVWTFAIVVAVNQIGIATTLVNTLFMAVVGAIALALGLAFGLGGRETAAEIVRNWYGKAQQNSSQIVKTAESAARTGSAIPASVRSSSAAGTGLEGRSGPT